MSREELAFYEVEGGFMAVASIKSVGLKRSKSTSSKLAVDAPIP